MAAGDTLRRITQQDSWILDSSGSVVGLKNPNASGRDLRFDSQAKLPVRQSRIQLPARLNVRQVMASAPTVTAGAASSMTSPITRWVSSANGSFPMGLSLVDWASVPKRPIGGVNVTTGNGPTYSNNVTALSFIHDGQTLEFIHNATSTPFLLKVDDQYVTMTPQNVAAGSLFVKYDFGSAKRRRIDYIGYNTFVTGVNIAATDSLEPAPIRGPRVIVVGDSFTAGSGATGTASNAFPVVLSDVLGWDDIWPSGSPGTGFVATNGGASPAYVARIPHDVLPYSPEVVWFVGSVNDDASAPAAVGTAVLSCIQTVLASLPTALVIVSPTASAGVNKMAANKLAIKAAMKAAAQAGGALWVDPLELPVAASATPQSGFFQAAASASASSIVLYGTQAVGGPPQVGGTLEIGSGATLERIQVKTAAFAGNDAAFNGGQYYYTVTFDGALQYAHPRLDAWTQVGGSYLTGIGKAGATTGFGNADRYVYTDGVHPSDAGHWALAEVLAHGLMNALSPN